jgi:hypothetical protein
VTMEFALNYSRAAEELLCAGKIRVDRFKCPAWQDLVTTVQQLHTVYVHFPLLVGLGIGDVMMKTVEAILLAICVLLVIKLTTFSVIERYSEIGTLRALGFSRAEIVFQFDPSIEYAIHMEELFQSIHQEEPKKGPDGGE